MSKVTPKTIKSKLRHMQIQLEAGATLREVATQHKVSLKTLERYITAEGQLTEAGLRLLFDF